ncbi:MAG: hypothetical protein WC641_06140 [Patescibacteria group bacterium]
MASKTARQELFIRVPHPNGEETYVEIDLSRVSLEVLTEIYTKTYGDRDRKIRYIRAHGTEALVNTGLNATEILRQLDETTQECRERLVDAGTAGEEVMALFEALGMRELLEALCALDCDLVAQRLRHGLYGFMGKATKLAGNYAEALEAAQQSKVKELAAYAVIEASNSDTDRLYLEWDKAINDMNASVVRLEEIEVGLRKELEKVLKLRDDWSKLLAADHPDIILATKTLTGDQGFEIKTFRYRGEPERRAEMESLMDEARKALAKLNSLEAAAQDGWERYGTKIFQEIFPLRAEIQETAEKLGKAWQVMSEKESSLDKSSPRPHQIHGALVTPAEYEQATARMRDQKWGRKTAENRLFHVINGINDMRGNKPCLPEEIREDMRLAERRIERLCHELADAKKTRSATVPPPPPPPVAASESVAQQPKTRATIEPNQIARHYYEIILAIGYVLTCNRNGFIGTTLYSVLMITHYLGKCGTEHIETLRGLVEPLIQADQETVEFKGCVERLETSDKTWLNYHNHRVWVIKMTPHGAEAGKANLLKHGFTETQVREAYQRLADERKKTRAGRQPKPTAAE